MSKDVEKTEYGTGTWDTPPSDEDYTLEEILAEYGSSRQQKIMEEVERETAPAEPDTPKAPAPEQPSAPEPTETARPNRRWPSGRNGSPRRRWNRTGRPPLPTIRTRRKNSGQMTARSRRLPAS